MEKIDREKFNRENFNREEKGVPIFPIAFSS